MSDDELIEAEIVRLRAIKDAVVRYLLAIEGDSNGVLSGGRSDVTRAALIITLNENAPGWDRVCNSADGQREGE